MNFYIDIRDQNKNVVVAIAANCNNGRDLANLVYTATAKFRSKFHGRSLSSLAKNNGYKISIRKAEN